jgi:hypothetical protein
MWLLVKRLRRCQRYKIIVTALIIHFRVFLFASEAQTTMMFSNQEQGSLIEDWGPRVVSADVAMELEKKVTFSEFSYRRVYTSVPYYEACKSYTSAD